MRFSLYSINPLPLIGCLLKSSLFPSLYGPRDEASVALLRVEDMPLDPYRPLLATCHLVEVPLVWPSFSNTLLECKSYVFRGGLVYMQADLRSVIAAVDKLRGR